MAKLNPITYVVEAIRSLVNDGWIWADGMQALLVILLLGAVMLTGAVRAFRKAVS